MRRAGPPLLALLLGLGFWQGVIELFNLPPYLVPGPWGVALAFWQRSDLLLSAALVTFEAALAAAVLSGILGLAAALAMGSSEFLRRAFLPYATVIQTTPVIAVAPLIVVWFGFGFRSVVLTAVITSIFPVIATTTTGLLSADPRLEDLFRFYRAPRWTLLFKLRLPASLPYFLSGLRIAAGLAVVGAIVAEYVSGMGGSRGGLGFVLVDSAHRLEMEVVFAAALLAIAMGILFLGLVNLLGRWLLRGRPGSE